MRPASTLDNDFDDESLDLQAKKDFLSLVVRAPRRHPKLSAALFFFAAAIAVVAAIRIAPTYRAESILLVKKKATLPTFGETARNVPANEYDPSTGVSEAVKGRDNLLVLVRQTHLVERTNTKQTPGKAPLSPEERAQILAKTLEDRLDVKSDGTTVAFTADWTDAQTAYDLVSAAVHNFLDNRNAAEVSVILDAITMLEDHVKTEREGIDAAMAEFLRMKEGWKTGRPVAPNPDGSSPRAIPEVALDTGLARRLEEKKQQIKEIQDERRKQLAEMRTQMAGLLSTFTSSHPSVVALQRKIEAIAEEPPHLAALKNEERGMLSELAAATGVKGEAARAGGALRAMGAGMALGGGGAALASKQDLEIADPASAMALSKLQNRIHSYEGLMDQIGAARLQLDLARNAFKYRYAVYKPAEVPLSPRRPVRLFVLVGGILFGVILAFGTAAALDLGSGRFIEPWQVKRKLSVPLLGEVLRP